MIEEISKRLASYAPRTLVSEGLPRAAVLIPLYHHHNEVHVVLTKRTDRVEHHKGEISFPGGAMDLTDPAIDYTALRESDEEIGLRPEDVRLTGRLDDIVTVSRFHVTAFVGEIDPNRVPYSWRPQVTEVAEVLEVPISHLMDRRNQIEVPRMRNGEMILMEAFQFHDHIIWGATGRMLKNLLEIAAPSGVPLK